jgi:hypothetical protein
LHDALGQLVGVLGFLVGVLEEFRWQRRWP